MARLKKLARRGTWEAALFGMPPELTDHLSVESVLLIGERRTSLLRASEPVEPGTDVTDLVLAACRAPHVPPGRAKTLRCPPSQLEDFEAAAEAMGAKLVPDTELTLVIAAFEHLMDQFMARYGDLEIEERVMPFPDLEVWKPVLKRLSEVQPWKTLDEGVVFEVEHPELGTWYALILGTGGEVYGLSLYSSIEDMAIMGEGPENPDFSDVTSLNVHLDPLDEMPRAHAAWCTEHGLVFNGMAPLVFEYDGDGMGPVDPSESQDLAAMVEAVLTLIEADGAALRSAPTMRHVPTAQGPIEVATLLDPVDDVWDPPAEPMIVEPHLLFFERDADPTVPTRVCIKAAKKDAERIAERIGSVGTLEVVADSTLVTLYVVQDPGIRWELQTFVRSVLDDLEPLDQLFAVPPVLVVMKGGAKRRSLSPSDVLLEHPVDVDVEVEAL